MSGLFSLQKYRKFFNATLFAFTALLIALTGVVATASDADAAKLQSTMTLEELGRSSSYYATLRGCVERNMYGDIKASSDNYGPTQINWFDDNEAWGYIYPDGKTDCRIIMSKALSLWGVTGREFLAGIGYKQGNSNEYNWNGPSDGSKRRADFESYVKRILGNNEPQSPGGAGAYLRYDGWWKKFCAVERLGRVDALTDPIIKERVNSGYTKDVIEEGNSGYTLKYDKIARVDGIEWAYSYRQGTFAGGANGPDYAYAATGHRAEVRRISCDDTKAALAQYAPAYSSYLDLKAIESLCADKGYLNIQGTPGINAMDACINGYKNKLSGNDAYCNTTYPEGRLREACAAGYNTKAEDVNSSRGELAEQTSGSNEPVTEAASTCTVEAVGWLICPAVYFTAGIVDAAYTFVEGLLTVQPLNVTDQNSGIYGAWSIMRNIANVAFVIAFLIIVFSQLTSFGVSNYGIKKMLPRLVIAAILVNISYWICAIAVDISNIAGASINQLFDVMSASIQVNSVDRDPTSGGTAWANIAGGVLTASTAAVTVYYLGLSALIPAIIAAALAIITVFIVLTLRQALIILLIVIAPIAFVAFLLPNTEGLFTKWRKFLMTLLLMYPIIGAIFGASAFASKTVMNSSDNVAVEIMGALISILPLAITPVVMKTAGGVLNRFAGIVNNAEKGPFDRLRKSGSNYRDYRNNLRNARALNSEKPFSQLGRAAFVRRSAKNRAIQGNAGAEMKRAEQTYIAGEVMDDTGKATQFGQRLAGANPFGQADPAALQRALAGAKFTLEKVEADEIKAEHAMIADFDESKLLAGLRDVDASPARQAAMMSRLIKVSDPEKYAGLVNKYGSDNSEKNAGVRSSIAEALAQHGPKFLKGSDLDMISSGSLGNLKNFGPNGEAPKISATEGNNFLQNIAKRNTAAGVYSQDKAVDETAAALKFAFDHSDLKGKQALVNTAAAAKANDSVNIKIKHNRDALDNLSEAKNPGDSRP